MIKYLGKIGLIDTKGEFSILLGKYDWIDSDIYYGRHRIMKDSYYGFIDENGDDAVAWIYEEVLNYAD